MKNQIISQESHFVFF